MDVNHRTKSSTYIEWAKLCTTAKYNLATSGIMNYPLSELGVSFGNLEINGSSAYGFAPLRERLAWRFDTQPECVVEAAGTSMANHLVLAALLDSGDDVLIERPAYGPFLDVASYLRANILRFDRSPENNFQINTDELKSKITPKTRLIVLANLHNPSGAFTEEKTLVEIGRIAAQVGAYVLVDEAYLDMALPLPHDQVRSSFHLGNNFVVTSSLTKTYGLSGLRCGWTLAERKLADRIWKLNDLFGVNAAHPAELLSVLALDNLEKVAARSKKLLETNRQALDAFLDSRNDLEFVRPPWGTVVFPRLASLDASQSNESADHFCEFLRTKFETGVVPGRFFEMPQHFRIGIGGESEMTKKGLDQLAQALDTYQGPQH